MVIFSPIIDIALVAFGLALVSMVLQVKLFKKREKALIQKKIKEIQKKISELTKKGGDKKEIDRLQEEMLKLLNEQMKDMPKQMIVSMIIFLPPFYFIREIYGNSIHMLHPFGLDIPLFGTTMGWFEVYIICSLISSLVLNAIVDAYEKNKVKNENGNKIVKG
ncbi:MAG: EMC3/TMCO1 family protein [Candidatus Diapherotrites archaeon]